MFPYGHSGRPRGLWAPTCPPKAPKWTQRVTKLSNKCPTLARSQTQIQTAFSNTFLNFHSACVTLCHGRHVKRDNASCKQCDTTPLSPGTYPFLLLTNNKSKRVKLRGSAAVPTSVGSLTRHHHHHHHIIARGGRHGTSL